MVFMCILACTYLLIYYYYFWCHQFSSHVIISTLLYINILYHYLYTMLHYWKLLHDITYYSMLSSYILIQSRVLLYITINFHTIFYLYHCIFLSIITSYYIMLYDNTYLYNIIYYYMLLCCYTLIQSFMLLLYITIHGHTGVQNPKWAWNVGYSSSLKDLSGFAYQYLPYRALEIFCFGRELIHGFVERRSCD